MPHTPPSPATNRPTTTPQPTARAAALTLEERLTFTNATMTMRLDEANVAYEINTAHIETEPVDLADIVTGPGDTSPAPLPDLYPTPIATVLQRAHHRLITDGWCKDTLVDSHGAACMLGAIRAEAHGNRHLEDDAARVLLEAIRRQFGDDIDSVPTFNDAFGTGHTPIRMVAQAASLADARRL